jgi:hypothetical protein
MTRASGGTAPLSLRTVERYMRGAPEEAPEAWSLLSGSPEDAALVLEIIPSLGRRRPTKTQAEVYVRIRRAYPARRHSLKSGS